MLGIAGASGHMDIDICVPNEKIAIAYDGEHFHKEKYAHDYEISYLLASNGYKVFRIREDGLEDINCENVINLHTTNNPHNKLDRLYYSVVELLNYLDEGYELSMDDFVVIWENAKKEYSLLRTAKAKRNAKKSKK